VADRNRNGIDDSRERGSLSGYLTGINPPSNSTPYAAKDQDPAKRTNGKPFSLFGGMFPTNSAPVGGGAKFQMRSTVPPMGSDDWLAGLARRGGGRQQAPEESRQASFADTLAQAIEMMKSLGGGGGGVGRISYDPQRATARANASEADKHLAAMYAGLVSSIEGDAPGIQASYDEALASHKEVADETSETIKQGYQSGSDMLTQQAQALGIQQAVANQINSGQTAAGDLQQALASVAQASETAQTQTGQNRQAALQYNTVVGDAAEQEGAAQRAARQAELQRVLSQIDQAEMEQNTQIDMANASRNDSINSSAMNLAQWLYGNDVDERRYQDSLQAQATEMANERYIAGLDQEQMGIDRVSAESIALLQELLGYSDPREFQRWVQDNPSGYASLAKLLS
jgi:hypothetical protein